MELQTSEIEQLVRILMREWASRKSTPQKIRYAGPSLGPEEYDGVMGAIFSNWWSGGRYTLQAEEALAKLAERSYGLMVNSGSSANLVMMSAARDLYFKDDDQILTLACGFPTTVSPIMVNRMRPYFVDIDLETLNLTPETLERHLRHNQKIRGVFVALTLGFVPDIRSLVEVCRKYGVEIFFDCCDAYGSIYQDRSVLSYSKAASLSFYVAHHISTGEGGAVVTNDQDLMDAMRGYRGWGRYCQSQKCCIRAEDPNLFCPPAKRTRDSTLPDDYIVNYQYEWLGYNLKPLELQAAMLKPQLEKLTQFNQARIANYEYLLDGALSNFHDWFTTWDLPAGVSPFAFPLMITDKAPFKRKNLTSHLQRDGIETRMLFGGNLARHPAFERRRQWYDIGEDLTNSDNIMENMLLLGVSQVIDSQQIWTIDSSIANFCRQWD